MSTSVAAEYASLREKDEIRLLDLLPGSGSEPIRCTLRHVKLSDSIQYEALSYAWGTDTDAKEILIDSKARLIRQNLWFALKYLRKRGVPRVLWIDALCINQTDDGERGHQVRQMGTIYSCATSVCVWLGLPDSSSYGAMMMLRETPTFDSMRSSFTADRFKWHSVARLFERQYWTRLWIIQEIVLAAKVNV
ncbi:HET-domain-containing protein, partial [Hyaloscypha variabilis F]